MNTTPQDTDFANAFAAAAAAPDGPVIENTPPAETPPAETPPAETPPAETPPAETPPAETPPAETPPAETPPAETPPAETPPAETPPASADDIVKGLADLLKQNQAQPTPEPAPAASDDPPLYSQDEVGLLADYEKNWPDVAQAETLKRRAEYHDLMKFVFSEVARYTQPLFEQMKQVGNTIHLNELKAAVPDYSENLEADVAAWVDTQPTYLQDGMKRVMQQGTSDEVADLIGRYRAATGTAQAPAVPAAPVPAAPATPAKTELSSAAKQAAESLAPVSGDRTQVPQGEDPQDFVSAFARYAAETMPK